MNRNRGIRHLKPDTAQKNYWKDNRHFADLFNAALFDGHGFIKADDLEELDSAVHEGIRSGMRDIIKVVKHSKKLKMNFAILAIENQEHINYAMPLRIMEYDTATYKRQYNEIKSAHKQAKDLRGEEYLSGFSKKDRLIPVITICIYYGEKSWDGPVSLMDMLDLMDASPLLRSRINDYKLIIIEAGKNTLHFRDEQNHHLFELMRILANPNMTGRESKKACVGYCAEHKLDEATADVLRAVTGDDKIIETQEEEPMAVKRWSVYDRWEADEAEMKAKSREEGLKEGRETGLKEGREEGREEAVIATVQIMLESGWSDKEIAEKISGKFGLTKKKVGQYIEMAAKDSTRNAR